MSTNVVCSTDDEAAWLQERQRYVCASDMPELIEGALPDRILAMRKGTLGERKRGKVVDDNAPDKMRAKAEWGHRHEQCIATKFTEETGIATYRWQMLCAHPLLPIAATLDFVTEDGVSGLECKTSYASQAAKFRRDTLPDDVVIQTQIQMLVMEFESMWVAWLLDGWDFGYVEVKRDDAMIDSLVTVAMDFYTKEMEGKT